MSELLGQPVVVENKTGASGSIGTMAVKQSNLTTATLLVTTIGTVVLAPMVTKDASFDPVRASRRSPTSQWRHLFCSCTRAFRQRLPGFVTWATAGQGVDIAVAGPTPEVATALLAQQAQLNLVNVPFAAAAPRRSRCWPATPRSSSRAPSVQMMEFIKQGKLKGDRRDERAASPAVPGAVPLNKFVPGYVQDINFALWAPARHAGRRSRQADQRPCARACRHRAWPRSSSRSPCRLQWPGPMK
ncbi:MAG: hypothetical protein IPK05_09985 [Comamonadaceae bacterium]|nr:hypothetical protein [Comamonadaceae bacterium]